jgi:hypothetical protein
LLTLRARRGAWSHFQFGRFDLHAVNATVGDQQMMAQMTAELIAGGQPIARSREATLLPVQSVPASGNMAVIAFHQQNGKAEIFTQDLAIANVGGPFVLSIRPRTPARPCHHINSRRQHRTTLQSPERPTNRSSRGQEAHCTAGTTMTSQAMVKCALKQQSAGDTAPHQRGFQTPGLHFFTVSLPEPPLQDQLTVIQ